MQQITITITVTPEQATLLHAGAAATGLPLAEALLRPIPQEKRRHTPKHHPAGFNPMPMHAQRQKKNLFIPRTHSQP